MAVQFVLPRQQQVDNNGNPLSGAKLYFFEPGTTTPKDVFSDDELSVAIDQSEGIAADAAGRWPRIYCDGKYKVTVTTAADVLIYTEDDFDPGLSTALGSGEALPVNAGGTGATTAPAARNNLGAASQASVTTNTSNITSLGNKVNTGLNVGDPTRFGLLAPEDEVTRELLAADFGTIVLQQVRAVNTANTSINSATPAQDTSIPQIGEGTEIISQAFTPKSASSTIVIEASVRGGAGSNSRVVASIHKTGTDDALGTDNDIFGNNDGTRVLVFATEASGSTDARTYTVRVGGTFVLNTVDGTADFGGVLTSHLKITELLAV